jgi:hypothetical protein
MAKDVHENAHTAIHEPDAPDDDDEALSDEHESDENDADENHADENHRTDQAHPSEVSP